MKRLFSVFMLAVVATVAFAFTTPKSAAFATTFHFDGSAWVVGEGDNCPGTAAPCEITTSTTGVAASALPAIAAQAPAGFGGYTTSAIDHDGLSSTPNQAVVVTSILRFQ